MSAIDEMEDRILPLAKETVKIRELISSLELCHHKAERWVDNIIKAIGTGETSKGLGTRSPGQPHPIEHTWQNARAALSAWVSGSPAASLVGTIETTPASQLLACLGERSPLKEWQVQQVIEKIQSIIHWPESANDPAAQYTWLLLGGDAYESSYRSQCPEPYKEHEDFWLKTARTIIRDTENGEEAGLSLALAIDMLWPCHWRFVDNLQIVLAAIGGNLDPIEPFAACGRNISLLPNRQRIKLVTATLKSFCEERDPNQTMDEDRLAMLGAPTLDKKWLAASLEKTIRLQLDPPVELRAMSALAGPDWIRSSPS
jgi:hypothetical protein